MARHHGDAQEDMNTYSIYRMGDDVFLNLQGHFAKEAAEDATRAFIELIEQDEVRFIVDLGKLKSYDKEARIRWQQVLKPVRKQISIIYFLGEAPPLIRMAASAVALAVGVRMKFVASQADVPPSPSP